MGLIGGMARTAVVAGTATAVSNRVSRRQAGRWQEKDQQQYEHEAYEQQQQQQQYAAQQPQYAPQPQYAAPAPAAPAAATSTQDRLAQLQQLAELKAAGVLTDAEFEQQKAKILAS
jgi:hypothetical protein